MKERITITLDDDLINEVDHTVDGQTIKNRSHAIELLLNKALRKKTLTKAILLAGGPLKIGLGKSKKSPSNTLVNGRPIIMYIMYSLKKYGINDFIIVGRKGTINPLKELFDNTNFKENVTYIEEPDYMGTAGAFKLASEHITGPVVVCNTNALFQIDLDQMFQFHKNSGSMATISLTSVPDVSNYGVVLLNGTKIFSFEEKPKHKIPSNLVNAGCYILEPEVLEMIPEGYGRFEIDVFPKLAKQEELSGYVFYGKWIYVSDEESLEMANRDW